jgi:hypothetical protein
MADVKGPGPVLLSYFLWVTFKCPNSPPEAKKTKPSIPHVAHDVERRRIAPELAVDGMAEGGGRGPGGHVGRRAMLLVVVWLWLCFVFRGLR